MRLPDPSALLALLEKDVRLPEDLEVLGARYQGILAGSDIEVQLRSTDGAKENLRLLNDPDSGIQIGFMQGGVSNSRLAPDLLSLGRIDYQIFWLFYPTGETVTDLSQLRGKRIALGPVDSGDRAVCEKILAAAGINYDNTALLYVAPAEATKALDDGTVDAVFLNLSPDSPILQSLLASPQYRPMSFSEAEALTRIFPYLVRLVLPRGAIDLQRKIPVADIHLVSTTNVVLVRKEIHPAIIDATQKSWFRPEGAAATLIGVELGSAHADPEKYDEPVDAAYVAGCRAALATRLPVFEDAPMRGGWAGMIMMSPDGRPIIERVGSVDGLWVMAGDSGTSFKTSPAIGRCLAEWITAGAPSTADLAPFSSRRFSEGRPWHDADHYGRERLTISR